MSGALNADLGMANSYYVATANPFAPCPKLQGDVSADVVVIGGGVTGLSAALHARAKGLSVVLIEGGRVGWGASGRNGGQMIPGLRKGAAELIKLYGASDAKKLFDIGIEARQLTQDLIAQHNIVCDLKNTGHLLLASRGKEMGELETELTALNAVMNYPHAKLLSVQEAHHEVGTPLYFGGLLDELGGHLHPLNYTLGLAEAALRAGVTIYEHSPALVTESAKGVVARTPEGSVKARHGVLACDAAVLSADARFDGAVMPVAAYICATEKLTAPQLLIFRDRAVSDTRFAVNYFRLSADGRMLFGGGERYSPRPPKDIAGFVRKHMIRVFPRLWDAKIEYAWGGMVSITRTRLPHVGRRGDLFFAHGYSGQGVLMSGMVGKVLAEALGGTAAKFDVLAKVAPPLFPGGAALRDPLYVLGMLWFAMRDRV